MLLTTLPVESEGQAVRTVYISRMMQELWDGEARFASQKEHDVALCQRDHKWFPGRDGRSPYAFVRMLSAADAEDVAEEAFPFSPVSDLIFSH